MARFITRTTCICEERRRLRETHPPCTAVARLATFPFDRGLVTLAAMNSTSRTRGVGWLLGLLLATCGSLPVGLAAQDTLRAGDINRPDSLDLIRLDSLRVRVLRSPVQLGAAPFSVSVVGSPEIRGAKGLVSIEEVLQGVPGLQVQDRFNDAVGERLSVRGFGSRAQFGVRGVKVFVDDIPATLADGQSTLDHLDLGTLGRAEVLRGPGSMLYGGAAGGVVRFESERPPAFRVRQNVRALYGSHGYYRLNSSTSGTAGATGYLVGLGVARRDGFRTNPLQPDGDAYGGSTRLQFNGRVQRTLGSGQLSFTANVLDLDAENPGSLSDSLLALGDRQAFRFNVLQNTNKKVRQAQTGIRWAGSAGPGVLDVAGYGVRRTLDNPIPSDVIDLTRTAAGVRALFRSREGERGPVQWAAGAELDLQRDDRKEFENDGGDRGAQLLEQFERVRAMGLFANAVVRPADRVTVAGGVRFDQVAFDVEDRFAGPGDGDGSGASDDSGSRTLDRFSPSLGLHVQATPSVGLFANVSTSFQTPTTTELANRVDGAGGFNPDLEPAASVGTELGARGRVGARAAWEIVAFRTRVTDELVPFEVASAPGRRYFRNAGSSTYKGVELALTTWLSPALRLRGTYSYLDAHFDEYVLEDADYSGNPVPGHAPHRLDATLRYARPWGHLEAHVARVSEVPVDDAGQFRAEAYSVLDLRAGLRGVSAGQGGMTVAPFVALYNVLDSAYSSSVVVNAFGRRYFEPAPGRRVHLGVSATWARR